MATDRMIDRIFPFFTLEAREAFLRLAGNYQQNPSENLLKAWAHELENVDSAAFILGVKRCIASTHVVHFPRWAEFKAYLPSISGESQSQQSWYDAYSGEWGGPWPVPGAALTRRQIEKLDDVRAQVLRVHASQNSKRWDYQGVQREKLIAMLDAVIGDQRAQQPELVETA